MTDSIKTSLPGSVALQYNESLPADSPYSTGFRIRPLVVSDPSNTWNKMASIDSSTDNVTFYPEQGDSPKKFPLILSLTRAVHNKEQRIIVSGDADFMSNGELTRGGNANPYLVTGIFSWMSYGAFPIDVSRPVPTDNNLKVDKKEIKWLKFAFLFMIPLLTGIWCAILLIRRSRK
jgi:ABC-2 type transport system permease protein